jgi:hypothetical protein
MKKYILLSLLLLSSPCFGEIKDNIMTLKVHECQKDLKDLKELAAHIQCQLDLLNKKIKFLEHDVDILFMCNEPWYKKIFKRE